MPAATICNSSVRRTKLMEMIVTVDKNPDGSSRKRRYRRNQRSEPLRLHRRRSQDRPAIHSSIIPYISGLHELFTRYKLKYVMSMRSAYGIRLYELCLQ